MRSKFQQSWEGARPEASRPGPVWRPSPAQGEGTRAMILYRYSPPRGQTDITEKITFPQTTYVVSNHTSERSF